MKYKVKFRLAADDGKKQKYSVNMEEGSHLVLGSETLGSEFRDLIDSGPICVLDIKDGALSVRMHEKSTIKLNNKDGNEFGVRPGDFLQARKFVIEFLEVPYQVKSTAMETRFVDINEIPGTPNAQPVPQTSAQPVNVETLKPSEQTLMAASLTQPKSLFEDLKPKVSEEKTLSGQEKTPTSVWEEVTAQYLVRPSVTSYTTKKDLFVSFLLGGFASAIVFQIVFKFLELKNPFGLPGAAWGFALAPIAASFFALLLHLSANFFGIAASFGGFFRYFSVVPLFGLVWALSFAFPRSVTYFATFLYAVVALGVFVFWFRPVRKIKFYISVGSMFAIAVTSLFFLKPETEIPHEVNVTEVLSKPAEESPVVIQPQQAAQPAPHQPVAQAPVAPESAAPAPVQSSAPPAQNVNMPVRSEVVAPAAPAQPPVATAPQAPPRPQVERVGELKGRMADVPEYDGSRTKASTPSNRRSVSSVPDPLVNEEFFNAARTGNLKVLKELINSRAVDANFTLDRGTTALMYACANGHIQLVKYLVSARVNVNAKDPYGTTALMWASAKGHKQVVEFLLAKGADPSVRRDDGRNALEIAVKWKKADVVKVLDKYRKEATRSLASPKKK
jgi:hypothetical protein